MRFDDCDRGGVFRNQDGANSAFHGDNSGFKKIYKPMNTLHNL